MSGVEIIAIVFGGIDIARSALEMYRSVKPDRLGASLERTLRNEKEIYHQFVRKLLSPVTSQDEMDRLINDKPPEYTAWKNPQLLERLQKRYGQARMTAVMKSLEEINERLSRVETELRNISEGTVSVMRSPGRLSC